MSVFKNITAAWLALACTILPFHSAKAFPGGDSIDGFVKAVKAYGQKEEKRTKETTDRLRVGLEQLKEYSKGKFSFSEKKYPQYIEIRTNIPTENDSKSRVTITIGTRGLHIQLVNVASPYETSKDYGISDKGVEKVLEDLTRRGLESGVIPGPHPAKTPAPITSAAKHQK